MRQKQQEREADVCECTWSYNYDFGVLYIFYIILYKFITDVNYSYCVDNFTTHKY